MGVVKEGFRNCEPDVADIVKGAAYVLERAGATVAEVSIPLHTNGRIGSTPFYLYIWGYYPYIWGNLIKAYTLYISERLIQG